MVSSVPDSPEREAAWRIWSSGASLATGLMIAAQTGVANPDMAVDAAFHAYQANKADIASEPGSRTMLGRLFALWWSEQQRGRG